jgi:hypothetical protein
MKKTLTPLALLLALIALIAAGCGDDGGDSTSDTVATTEAAEPLSDDEYTTSVSDIMAPLGTQLQDAGADASAAVTPDQVTQALDDSETALNEAIDALGELAAPEDVQSLNDELVSTLEGYRDTVVSTNDELDGASEEEATEISSDFVVESQDFAAQLQDLTTEFADAGIEFQG